MVAREMHPAFRPWYVWPQFTHLPRSVPGRGAKGPRILIPDLRYSAFEVFPDLGKSFLHLLERKADSLAFVQFHQPADVRAAGIGLQYASSTRLKMGNIPNVLNREIGVRGENPLFEPEPLSALHGHPGSGRVRQFSNRFLFPRRERGRDLDVPKHGKRDRANQVVRR